MTRTIYSNSERSEQFLVTECFFKLFVEIFSYLRKQNNENSHWKKLLVFRNMPEKLEKVISWLEMVKTSSTYIFRYFFCISGDFEGKMPRNFWTFRPQCMVLVDFTVEEWKRR